jgi:hypothetical protein
MAPTTSARRRTTLAVLPLLVLAPLAPGPWASSTAHAATGGLGLNAWCARHNPGYTVNATSGPPPRPAKQITPAQARVEQPNAYGWACVSELWVQNPLTGQWTDANSNLYRSPVDMRNACEETYGSQAVPHYANWNDPYSWYCTF